MQPQRTFPKEGKCGEKSDLADTAFRCEEKRYKLHKSDRREKRIHVETDFTDTVDMRHMSLNTPYNNAMIVDVSKECGRPAFRFLGVEGLLFFPQHLDTAAQRSWLTYALTTSSQSAFFPNNLTTLDPSATTLTYQSGMRWSTMGFNYNWTLKEYSRDRFSPFPPSLHALCCQVASTAAHSTGACSTYDPQTAIVNYFPVGTMMMAHQDVSEECVGQPLISISLGCSSVFLMGTENRVDKPHAFFLRSGDVVLFTGPSRRAFHGVPRVLDDCPKELVDEDGPLSMMSGLRVNINVRQVYPEAVNLPDVGDKR
jgi:alkylated DNA repair protein alkB family protein 1